MNVVEEKRVQIKLILNADIHDISPSTMDSSELYHVKQQFFLGSHFRISFLVSAIVISRKTQAHTNR